MKYLIIPIKIVLIIMIYIGLGRMPNSYYELLRISIFIGFISLMTIDIKIKNYYFIVPYFITLALFNPIDKIYFKRDIWHLIDITTILFLFASLVIDGILLINKNKR